MDHNINQPNAWNLDQIMYNISPHAVEMQLTGAMYLTNKQLLLSVFARLNTAVQSQKAVSAYFTSKQILPFGFAEQNTSLEVTVLLWIALILWVIIQLPLRIRQQRQTRC